MNLPDLLRRAEAGEIRASEVAEVAAELSDGDSPDDAYTLLLIIGKSGALQYRSLVERWLLSPDDAMMAGLALQILCNYWGETASYLATVREAGHSSPLLSHRSSGRRHTLLCAAR
jgi:hypothetical protein